MIQGWLLRAWNWEKTLHKTHNLCMRHSLAIWGEGVCCFINFMDSLYILHPNLLATYRYRLHLLHSASFFSFLLMSFGDKKFLISMSTNFAIFPLHLMLLVSSLKKNVWLPKVMRVFYAILCIQFYFVLTCTVKLMISLEFIFVCDRRQWSRFISLLVDIHCPSSTV